MSRVLIISNDIIGLKMAGCGLRPYEIAGYLADFHNVTLAAPNHPVIDKGDFNLVDSRNVFLLKRIVKQSDVIITQGAVLYDFPFIKAASAAIAVEIYTPFILEGLESAAGNVIRDYQHNLALRIIIDQILSGDYFICANERQRDFILGMLCVLNRINPYNYVDDKTFYGLIDIVPFGLPSQTPIHTKNVLKGAYKNIKKSDKLILWLGGIWDWLDPITAIEAMDKICRCNADIKLIFLGTSHPTQSITQACQKAINFSKKIGLYDKNVFFEEWIPYEARADYLMEADIGIITHPDHIETRFSHRSRVADYIWCNLPIIATKGGSMSDLIAKENLGITVDYNDADSLAYAIQNLLNDKQFYGQCKENLKTISLKFKWDKVLEPLNRFCGRPKKSADKKEYLRQWQFKFKPDVPDKKKAGYLLNRLNQLCRDKGVIQAFRHCLRKGYQYGYKTVCRG